MAGEKMGHVHSLTKNKREEGILFFDEKWGHYCFLNEKGGSNFFHNIFDIFYICGELNRGRWVALFWDGKVGANIYSEA